MKDNLKAETFRSLVTQVLGAFLTAQGFSFVRCAYRADWGYGLTTVLYRNPMCSLVVYDDPRNGEVNLMIGPPGLQEYPGRGWFYLPALAPDNPPKTLEQLCREFSKEFLSTEQSLQKLLGLLQSKLPSASAALASRHAS